MRQLARYGMEVRALGFLVRPPRFTPEEKRLSSVPMPVARGQDRAAAEATWVRRGGGVGRKALCMFANYLYPVQRVGSVPPSELGGEQLPRRPRGEIPLWGISLRVPGHDRQRVPVDFVVVRPLSRNTTSNSYFGQKFRVLRGGSWNNYNPTYFRGAYRDWVNPGYGTKLCSFRCARTR